MEDRIENLLIIGNGFDLSLGLKTSYNDFLESQIFKDYTLDGSNELAEHLKRNQKRNKWVDIERELSNYSKESCDSTLFMDVDTIKRKQSRKTYLSKDYRDICGLLKHYLKSTGTDLNLNSRAALLTYDVERTSCHIVSFNYTNSPILLLTMTGRREASKYITYIHGTLDTDIVFGIEDSVECNKEHAFLYKSYSMHQNAKDLPRLLEIAENIIFFGYSLGETDHSYFDDFFIEQCKPESKNKNFTFYHYGEQDYHSAFLQLMKLTNNGVTKLKKYNEIEFIDSSK